MFRIEDYPRDQPANPISVVAIINAFEKAGLTADAAVRLCDGRPPAKWTTRDARALIGLIMRGPVALRATVQAAP